MGKRIAVFVLLNLIAIAFWANQYLAYQHEYERWHRQDSAVSTTAEVVNRETTVVNCDDGSDIKCLVLTYKFTTPTDTLQSEFRGKVTIGESKADVVINTNQTINVTYLKNDPSYNVLTSRLPIQTPAQNLLERGLYCVITLAVINLLLVLHYHNE